jgi:probable O-glycosylation ligase (exosortase A-associated)
MRDLMLGVVVFGLLPYALMRPYVGLYLYSWISYMNPHRLAYGWAMNFPWAYILALVTLAGTLFSKEPRRMPWTRELTVLTLFVGWMLVTTLFAFYPDLAHEQLIKVLKIQLMIFVTPLLIDTKERLRGLVWVIVGSLGFFGVKGGIFTILKGGAYHVLGPDGSFIAGNNELALALLMAIPLMRYLQLTEPKRWVRQSLGAAMVLTGLSVVGSQSRGALIGGIAIMVFLWLKSRQKLMTAILIGFAVALIALVMPQEWYDRMATIETYQKDGSALGRINAWWTAWNVAVSHPLVGGGFDMFQAPTFDLYAPDNSRVYYAHSIYFQVLGEHGFVGLFLFLLLGFLAWRTASRVIRAAKSDSQHKWASDLAAMAQVSLIGYASAGAFLGLAYFDLPYHLVTIILLTRVLLEKEGIAVRAGRLPVGAATMRPPAAARPRFGSNRNA